MQIIRQFIYHFFLFLFWLFRISCLFASFCSRKKPQQPHCFVSSCLALHRKSFIQPLPAVSSVLAVELLVSAHVSCHLFISGIRCSGARWQSLSFEFYKFLFLPPILLAASYWVHKLVHQSLGHVRLADDAFLVVLTYGAAQLVVVHCRSILPKSPQSGDMSGVFDFENACWE